MTFYYYNILFQETENCVKCKTTKPEINEVRRETNKLDGGLWLMFWCFIIPLGIFVCAQVVNKYALLERKIIE